MKLKIFKSEQQIGTFKIVNYSNLQFQLNPDNLNLLLIFQKNISSEFVCV